MGSSENLNAGIRVRNALRGTYAYKRLQSFRQYLVDNVNVEMGRTRGVLMEAEWQGGGKPDTYSTSINGKTLYVSVKPSQDFGGEELDRMWV